MIPKSPSGRAALDWDAIARDYAGGVLSVREICALHAVPTWSLYDRAALDGWTLRRGGGQHPRRSPPDLTRRLLVALDLKMTQFEQRMTCASASASDSERDARTLGTLVRLFEKLKGFGEKAAASPTGVPQPATDAAASPGKDAHDADRIRQDLAQRLEKLRAGLGG